MTRRVVHARNIPAVLLAAVMLVTFCASQASAQVEGFSLISPSEGAAVVTGQQVTVRWTGGSLSDLVNILLVDTNPFEVAADLGVFANKGSQVVTLPDKSQLKCAHQYLVLIQNTQQTQWRYGPAFVVTCADQTTRGVVTATAFVGDGSGLTGITVATANSANFAASADSATVAGNSMALGGIAPASYARRDIGNTFTGAQTIVGNISQTGDLTTSGNVTIGGGTPIVRHLSATFNPAFPNLKPGACSVAALPFNGAAEGDTVALGVPNSRLTGGGALQYFAWISADDTVSIRVCNIDPNSPQKSPAAGNIRVDVWKH